MTPAFPIDWKESGDELKQLGWAFPARELRVRTAIDSQKRTAKKPDEDNAGGALFAWEMIHPFDDAKKPVAWRARIDLTEVKDRTKTGQVLARVLARLSFVSKTKARCEVGVVPVDDAETAQIEGEKLILVLQTPALLVDPRFQGVEGVALSGALSAVDMLALYQAAWSEISGGSLELSHHFATQSLSGGNYLYHQFQKKKGSNTPYDPFLLTDAGSVFVFDVKHAENAKQKLEYWLNGGLDLPGWAKNRFGDIWKHNPYLPQNGFGEIAVHAAPFARPDSQSIQLAVPILKKLAS